MAGGNIIWVPYCDGSIHMGDYKADYDSDGETDHWYLGLKRTSAAVTLMEELFSCPTEYMLIYRNIKLKHTLKKLTLAGVFLFFSLFLNPTLCQAAPCHTYDSAKAIKMPYFGAAYDVINPPGDVIITADCQNTEAHIEAGKGNEYWLTYNAGSWANCANRHFGLVIRDPNGWACASAPALPGTRQWYHLAGTYNGSNIRFYVNGTLAGVPVPRGTLQSDNYPFDIGSWSGDTAQYSMDGRIDDVRLYNYALSPADIQNLAREGDYTPPQVTNFVVTPTTIDQGQSITVNYTVTDNQELYQAEFWRAGYNSSTCPTGKETTCNWQIVGSPYTLPAGRTSFSNTFTSTLNFPRTFFFGLHVTDIPENWADEGAHGPDQVKVNKVGCSLAPGHENYCRDCGPCAREEGDCDNNSECEGLLVCYDFQGGSDYCCNPGEIWNGTSCTTADNVLRVHPTNPRYLTDGSGKAIYMTGSHNWYVLTDLYDPQGIRTPSYQFSDIEWLDYMVANNQNFLRLWVLELTYTKHEGDFYITPQVHERVSGYGNALDGGLKFDLTEFNTTYTNKLRKLIERARSRGIYVSIMFFEGWWMGKPDLPVTAENWIYHPYNPENNINNLSVTPSQLHTLDRPKVVNLQKAYIRNIIDAVNGYDNIMFEIANEDGGGDVDWQIHMMDYIRQYEANNKPKQHLVWLTTQAFNPDDQWLWDSTADAVSPGRSDGYQGGYNNRLKEPYMNDPPVTDGSKVVILDTDHFLGGVQYDWPTAMWKLFLRGYNPIIMDPYENKPDGWALDPHLVPAAGYTRIYGKKMDMANLTPSNNSLHCSTTYCLRNPGQEYLVYQPNSGQFTVNLVAGTYDYEWFNPNKGSVAGSGTISVGAGNRNFTPPFSGEAVLYLKNNF